MDDGLYRNERFKFGSKAREEAEFADHVARVRTVQDRLPRGQLGGGGERVFLPQKHRRRRGVSFSPQDPPVACWGRSRCVPIGRRRSAAGSLPTPLAATTFWRDFPTAAASSSTISRQTA